MATRLSSAVPVLLGMRPMPYEKAKTCMSILDRMRARRSAETAEPRFAVTEEGNVRSVRAQGQRESVVEAFFKVVQEIRGPLGIAMARAHEAPRVWTAEVAGRSALLSALFRLRDLLGGPGFDAVVHSDFASAEVQIDRFGSLEVRCTAVDEPGVSGILERSGFHRVAHVSVVPQIPAPSRSWTLEDEARFAEVRDALGMESRDFSDPEDRGEPRN